MSWNLIAVDFVTTSIAEHPAIQLNFNVSGAFSTVALDG
jgi:hypothetical protein